ncbi:hypothetical protein ACFVIM_34055 [Streptomyces sp. NPDC057638]|uniref:hypothetical protein n=1 Tax=Streptomyces sp. NPDC057638 TaxID=3346190 RepID=UPI0036ADC945
MRTDDRTERNQRMFKQRLETAAAAGGRSALGRADRWWTELRTLDRLTVENVRMDGFFDHVTRGQYEVKLWNRLAEALRGCGAADAVDVWHRQIAEAETDAQDKGGTMGHPTRDARRALWREANANFAQDASYSFRRVS